MFWYLENCFRGLLISNKKIENKKWENLIIQLINWMFEKGVLMTLIQTNAELFFPLLLPIFDEKNELYSCIYHNQENIKIKSFESNGVFSPLSKFPFDFFHFYQ